MTTRRKTLAEQFGAELIHVPGFRDVVISRADNCRAMIAAGHSAADADLFSFRLARPVTGHAHPHAYELAVAAGRDDRATIARLIDAA